MLVLGVGCGSASAFAPVAFRKTVGSGAGHNSELRMALKEGEGERTAPRSSLFESVVVVVVASRAVRVVVAVPQESFSWASPPTRDVASRRSCVV